MAPRTWVASPSEASVVAGLLAEFRDDLGSAAPADDELLAAVEHLLRADPRGTLFLLGAPGDGPAAGVAQLRFRLAVWTGAEDCHLEDLFVRAGARRSGLGRALVEAAVAQARERGCRRLDLDVDEANAPALALYERAGISPRGKYGSTLALFAQRRL